MIYSFNLSNFESGKFVATRFPENSCVSGDWVCFASSDQEAFKFALLAAYEQWAAPATRCWDDFTVEFVNSSGN